ncbi:MAG TPA: ATP-binding protein [Bryobacteraceae bacterium]|nr:ATP-binding protein [Bryobacteraceae bacterium]
MNRRSVTGRISGLSWLVALLTLGLFVTAIVPQQMKDLREALRSKAQGVASSLLDVTAGAAISEDFGSLVDQCVQVIAGDPAIDFLVITRNDGTALAVDRRGWRYGKLDAYWRPEERVASGKIQTVPLLKRRVFHFARPFDYSGLQWGWIHVGLSLESYDRSVRGIYRRTGVLTILCVCLSLLVSVLYAKRLVRPILDLQGVVQKVAQGDLSARASAAGGDEVASLARSFNAMADSILQRNRILESVRFAAQRFLTAPDWRVVILEVLGKIGGAAEVSRGFVFEVHPAGDGRQACSLRYEWVAPGYGPTIDDPKWQGLPCYGVGLDEWADKLGSGRPVTTHLGELSPSVREMFDPTVKSMIMLPVQVEESYWGFLGFSDRLVEREWSEAEQDSFQAAADMLGAAITRQRAQLALLEAKQTLEQRVLERTRELRELVAAKDRANAQLAEAQQRLVEISRMSGMAEVATGVLHNVGNVLNSVNVSATLCSDRIQRLRADNLAAAVGLLREHAGNLDEFLTRDPKGERLLPYLAKLGDHFQQDRQVLAQELDQLRMHVAHIKEIVATQQNYAKVSGLIEEVSLADLAEDALRIVGESFARHRVQVERDFEILPPVFTDKHAILQVLLNLLRNAQQAIKESQAPERWIRLRVSRSGEDRVRISVEDTGVGLAPELLTRVFAHGFTTKRDGHGFGLHSGALTAKGLGGSLWAESEGPGRGATFILELPATTAAEIPEESHA